MRGNRPGRGHTLPARLRDVTWDGDEASSPARSSLPQRKRSKSVGSSFDVWSSDSWEASAPSATGNDNLHVSIDAAPTAILSVEDNLSYLSSSRTAAEDAATMELLVRLCSEEEAHDDSYGSDQEGLIGHDLIDIFAPPLIEPRRNDYCSRSSTSGSTSPVDDKLGDGHAPLAVAKVGGFAVAPPSVATVLWTQAVAIPRAVPITTATAVSVSVASAPAHPSLGACGSWQMPNQVLPARQSMPFLPKGMHAAASTLLEQQASSSGALQWSQWCPPPSQPPHPAQRGPSYPQSLCSTPSLQPQQPPQAAVPRPTPGFEGGDSSCQGFQCGASGEERSVGGGSGRNLAERVQWSPQDDAKIVAGVRRHGCKWRVIAALLPGRSDDAVRNRWNRVKDLPEHRSSSDDGARATDAKPPKPRKATPNVQAAKKGKQTDACSDEADQENKRERVSWSRQEDELILTSVEQLGNKWHKIAGHLPGRTEHAIRNRFARLQSLASRGRPIMLSSGHGMPIGIQLVPEQVR